MIGPGCLLLDGPSRIGSGSTGIRCTSCGSRERTLLWTSCCRGLLELCRWEWNANVGDRAAIHQRLEAIQFAESIGLLRDGVAHGCWGILDPIESLQFGEVDIHVEIHLPVVVQGVRWWPCCFVSEALAGCDGEGLASESFLGAQDMSTVRACFDLPYASLPVLLVRAVALADGVELEAHRCVADLLSTQRPEPSIDVLAQHEGFHFFDADEVLLVQSAKAFDALLELVEFRCDVRPFWTDGWLLHRRFLNLRFLITYSGVMVRLSKQTDTSQLLKPKCS